MVNPIRRGKTMVRSIRMAETTWKGAQDQAEADGIAVNYAVELFLHAYSRGELKLPTVTTSFE